MPKTFSAIGGSMPGGSGLVFSSLVGEVVLPAGHAEDQSPADGLAPLYDHLADAGGTDDLTDPDRQGGSR